MHPRIRWTFALCALLSLCSLAAPALAQDRAYTEGPVTNVTAIKVMDGQFENYLTYLQKNWKQVMEASKKAGYVLDYHVYGAQAHNPNEADLYLVVTYPNMAMLDDMAKKMDPITEKVTKMNPRQADEASGKRVVMRTLLGEELLRELVLK
jgi:L-rhamnose mutarotase